MEDSRVLKSGNDKGYNSILMTFVFFNSKNSSVFSVVCVGTLPCWTAYAPSVYTRRIQAMTCWISISMCLSLLITLLALAKLGGHFCLSLSTTPSTLIFDNAWLSSCVFSPDPHSQTFVGKSAWHSCCWRRDLEWTVFRLKKIRTFSLLPFTFLFQ